MNKHPSYGYATEEELQELMDAPSPWHRKELKKELEKKIKQRANKKGPKK